MSKHRQDITGLTALRDDLTSIAVRASNASTDFFAAERSGAVLSKDNEKKMKEWERRCDLLTADCNEFSDELEGRGLLPDWYSIERHTEQ